MTRYRINHSAANSGRPTVQKWYPDNEVWADIGEPHPSASAAEAAMWRMIERDRHRNKVIDAWAESYAEWASGKTTSPNADDLAHYAHRISPVFPDTTEIADRIEFFSTEGHELDEIFDLVYGGPL